jgi:hypothetical protein
MGEEVKVNELEIKKEHGMQVSHHRDLLALLTKVTPSIKFISDCDINGDMSFAVLLKDIGLEAEDFYRYHRELSSNLIVDCMGELLIRENLSLFVPYLTSMQHDSYLSAVSHSNHKRFGMKVKKELMVFGFHISLLQEILTEDFKNV